MTRGAIYGWILAITLSSLAVAFVIRWLLKLVFRAEQMPRAEAFVDHWWVWAPLVTVAAGIWFCAGPLIGMIASVGLVILMRYWGRLYPWLEHHRHPDL